LKVKFILDIILDSKLELFISDF